MTLVCINSPNLKNSFMVDTFTMIVIKGKTEKLYSLLRYKDDTKP